MQPKKVRVPLFPHKRSAEDLSGTSYFLGRGDKIRTCDPMLPKHVRYQLRYTSILTAVIISVLWTDCK